MDADFLGPRSKISSCESLGGGSMLHSRARRTIDRMINRFTTTESHDFRKCLSLDGPGLRYPMCLMIASPNSEHLRRVAPSMSRSKS